MEALLSLAFDNISSRDNAKIRKGLRQIEGLLAQICLSKASSLSPAKRRASAMPTVRHAPAPKALGALPDDLAFREFFRLQEGFECNVASRLIESLERLLGMGANGDNDLLILSTLDLLQGILLLHPPSRRLFAREIYMNLLLDLLDSPNPPAIQSHALLVLVTVLLQHPQNTRTFEAIDGLLTVTSLFKSAETAQNVKLQVVEFLYFYLMTEDPSIASASAPQAALQRSPSKLLNAFNRRDGMANGEAGGGTIGADTRTTEEKQRMLGRYLSNVEDLVEDLKENGPFGEVNG